MNITKIISAIGDNSTVYPLLIRDCGIENPTKVAMTYNQNKRDKNVRMLATRERFFDEYITSAVWLGCIPLIEKINKSVIKRKGFNPEIDIRLLKENSVQGLEKNIKAFKEKAPEVIKEMEFLKKNKSKYMNLVGKKVFSESVIPMLLMGFVIPKVLFAWTANTKKVLEKTQGADFRKTSKMSKPSFSQKQKISGYETMDEFILNLKNNKNNSEDRAEKVEKKEVSFKGLITKMAEFSTKQKMMVTDGGYSAGRVITARNGFAAVDIGFKMLGMLYLNFLFPDQLANFLNKNMGKVFDTNLSLDIKMLDDKEFVDAVKNKKLKLPKVKTGEELLKYADKNPKSDFVKFASKYGKLKFLENGVRDPRTFVELDKLLEFKNNMVATAEKALKSKDVTKFMQKAKFVKGANILANIGISSFLLAWGLPKAQYAVREIITKCELEPGILD